jgi:hypothetical protein
MNSGFKWSESGDLKTATNLYPCSSIGLTGKSLGKPISNIKNRREECSITVISKGIVLDTGIL